MDSYTSPRERDTLFSFLSFPCLLACTSGSEKLSSAVHGANITGLREHKSLFSLFIVLQLTGFTGLVIILFTASVSTLSKKRHPSWSNFIVTWIISCVSYRLVYHPSLKFPSVNCWFSFLAGAPITWQPEYSLCLTQAALIYTVPTLWLTSLLRAKLRSYQENL